MFRSSCILPLLPCPEDRVSGMIHFELGYPIVKILRATGHKYREPADGCKISCFILFFLVNLFDKRFPKIISKGDNWPAYH